MKHDFDRRTILITALSLSIGWGIRGNYGHEIGAMIRWLSQEPNAPTIVLVEQNLNFALSIADRAYVLVKGEVAFEGQASALAADADLQHALIGLGSA